MNLHLKKASKDISDGDFAVLKEKGLLKNGEPSIFLIAKFFFT